MDIISSSQCRAARALLNWSQPDLADKCGIHVQTISSFENDLGSPSKKTILTIANTILSHGIILTEDDGVKRQSGNVRQYSGSEGFRTFMDDLYNTMNEKGGDMCLLNAHPELWIKFLGQDWYENIHVPRMEQLVDRIDFRVTVRKGDYNFIGHKFGEYRWIPEKIWDKNSFYSYGDKIGFLNFDDNDIQIFVLHHKKFAENYRFLFNLVWEQYTIIPDVPNYKPQKTKKSP